MNAGLAGREKSLSMKKGKSLPQWIGRNNSYKQIIVEGEFKLGDKLKVEIVKAETFDLRGKC